MDNAIPSDYHSLLNDIKERVRSAQLKASLAVNRELVLLYWRIGRDILARQRRLGWGAKVIDRLASDLHHAFPDMRGFSPRNLKYMRAFAQTYPQESFVQAVLAQIPWYHNITLLDKVQNRIEREWYVYQAIQNGWSRPILVHQIESGLYRRQGKAHTNFNRALAKPQSELAHQILKDPYNFDFLTLRKEAIEKDLEHRLLEHLRAFLLELGMGFAFVGSQYPLQVGSQDFYIDLLFYHLKLRCYVILELKIKEFQPEFAGKMNFYLSAVDDLLRHPDDAPSIGIILCKSRDRLVTEYALRDVRKPIGVAGYRLTEALPAELKGKLPSMQDLEAELNK